MQADIETVFSTIETQGRDMAVWKKKQETEVSELRNCLDDIETKLGRQALFGSGGFFGSTSFNSGEKNTLTMAVKALLSGHQEKADNLFYEAKAMSVGSDPDGGYVVHPLISDGMTKVMAEISPVYRLARKIPMSKGDAFEEPVDRETAEANWVSEVDPRNITGTPKLGLFRVPLDEIFAMPPVTQKLIDTASIDVLAWLQSKVGDAFAVKEGAAFHSGNGVGQPMGFLSYPSANTTDATRAWGTLEWVPSGSAAALTFDGLESLVGSMRAQYRNGAVWLMNRKTASLVRQIKNTVGESLWVSSLQLGQPDVLIGYAVQIDENMPDVAANSFPIAFANLQKGYTVAEMKGAKFLTDPYSSKPNVLLFAYRRVGGAVNNSEAIKLQKVAVS